MIRRSVPTLLCLAVLFVAAHLSSAESTFRVDEKATRHTPRGERAEVSLAFENPTGRDFAARATAELLDPRGVVRARSERDVTVGDGRDALELALPFNVAALAAAERRELPWFRLRYRVAPAPEVGAPAVEGVVSLSEITPDLFELHVSSPAFAHEGMRLRARVRAAHPVSQRPARGVRLEAEAALDGGRETKLRASAVTDAEGDALLDFELPRVVDGADEVRLSVRGRLGGLTQEAAAEVRFQHRADVIVSADKPIYQPGQTLRLRALLLDPFARRAISEAGATLKIRDPESALVFETALRTSRFGVAAADWPIAEGTRLGTYTARVEVDGDRYETGSGVVSFNVSRYELPTFAVSAEPDRKFYLPGEDAEVSVRADYLFGKPVPRGRVRVVREAAREWNYGKQKWEVDEEETYEGEADAAGSFRARIPLGEDHGELDGSERLRDLEFAAYYTDPSTNRTEQRRFALRVTREPIHVYVTQTDWSAQATGFPLEFYLSTFYADGTPAACEVAISEFSEAAEVAPAASPAGGARPLLTVKTNRFGLARVDGLLLSPDAGREPRLAITARDAAGHTGRTSESFDLGERTAIRVETDKSIYRDGKPLRVRLSSNRAEGLFALDVVQNQRLLHSQSVRLRGGAASVVIPSGKEFRDEVSVVAYALPASEPYPDDRRRGSRTVLFPRSRELRFDVRLDRREYRPGQEARADIRVRDADGREVESALGVVVADRAVEERARTDAEFGRHAAGYDGDVRRRLGGGESFAGVTLRDLERLHASPTPPDGLDLLAEFLLNRSAPAAFENFAADFRRDQRAVFESFFARQLRPVREALAAVYERRGEYPRDEAALRRILSAAGVDLDALRDPWGRPYELWFGTTADEDALEIISGAADKERASADDFVALRQGWPYFRPVGLVVERVVTRFYEREGRPLRDRRTLREELLREDVDLDALRDRWDRPYDVRFAAGGRDIVVSLRSGGPDGRLAGAGAAALDDFTVWKASVNYFAQEERRILCALDAATAATGRFPRDEAEFVEALRRAGVGPQALLDPWGRPYRLAFRENAWAGGQVTVRTYAPGAAREGEEARPVTTKRTLYSVVLSSLGADGRPDTFDDFAVADFARTLEDRGQPGARPTPAPAAVGGTGELSGVVLDVAGASIPAARVRATPRQGGAAREAVTDDEGRFVFEGLPAGVYELSVASPGFVSLSVAELVVLASHVTEVQAVLAVGAVTETVTVSSGVDELVNTTSAQVSGVERTSVGGRRVNSFLLDGAAAGSARQSETPRLREYFPEALVWQPLLETDREGRATVRFKLADNITTWKLAVVGSTLDGELGLAEAEIRAFQPFFVEHDPPRVLTEGDEISLPVVLRNYLERPQEVGLEFKPESWFALLGPGRKRARVAAGEVARETFDFRAVAAVKDGRQRVSALGPDESDAVERVVSVHPDGEEVTRTETHVLGAAAPLDAAFPPETIEGTARAELKLYPDLSAHLVESVEGIMRRPYGCGEQTVSSSYPSLLVLRHYRAAGRGLPPAARRAERYVREGYDRLLGYRTPGGGFTYRPNGPPDVALTAYALKFLTDARAVLAVDENVIGGARRWLLQQANADGSWGKRAGGDGGADHYRAARLTTYVVRVLAEAGGRAKDQNAKASEDAGRKAEAVRAAGDDAKAGVEEVRASVALKRAFDFLARRSEGSNDPYLLASFVLAADARGEREAAAKAARRLASLRRDEGAQTFWDVAGETPFHGWGLAGRIEVTALATRALAAHADNAPAAEAGGALAGRALLYLFRHKDAHGVWHSTQTTVNVLDALGAVSNSHGGQAPGASAQPAGLAAEIFVNGRLATSVTLLGEAAAGAPVSVDLTPFLASPGRNRVEVRRASGAAQATAQLVSTHYVPWDSAAASSARGGVGGAPSLKVSFERTEAEAGQALACEVEVRRGAGAGHGMLLAEVGLPPGVEVDRASLERARADAASHLDRYDVLPDRLVLYLWPDAAGAARLSFTFKPRYGVRALTAPSQVYDYYNPEARSVVPPARFVIR